MLAGDGEARARMLPSSEAQKRQGDSNAAMHHTVDQVIITLYLLLSQEEEEE